MAQLATNAQCWPWQGTEQAGTCSLDVGQDLGLARLRHYSGTEVAANIVPLAAHQCELPVESCASSQFGSPTPFETAGLGKTSTTNIDDLATILLGLGIGDLQSANIGAPAGLLAGRCGKGKARPRRQRIRIPLQGPISHQPPSR